MALNHPRRLISQFLASALLSAGAIVPLVAVAADDAETKAIPNPRQPKSGEAVTITIRLHPSVKATDLVLQYQIVEPGNYIALADAAYAENWKQIPLEPAAAEKSGDTRATLKCVLPPEIQKNRRLIRYRVFSPKSEAVVAPDEADTQRNYAYFVYTGIPEWKAAINPNGTGKERELVTFPAEVMRSVQAYHLLSKQESIENVTWHERMGLGNSGRHEYKNTGTLVADGKVYDHVRIRARGGNWRHAMGKNMWKIDFNKGHHFEARDNYKQRYETKWGKLNLGACIQQGDYGMRGEQGMFEAAAYRLFNLAGVEAPHTHWIQLRIVDGAEENPDTQYRGDFWGLYLATEEVDDDFLKEHALPEGNVYKMEFGDAKPEHLVKGGPDDSSDIRQFMSGISRNATPQWWQTNVNLPSYYSYRSIVECIHHYDIGEGKNYFFYHNPKARHWQVIPWDVDLTWGNHMYGNGAEPFYRAGLLRTEPFKTEYAQRLAEIRDLLFNPDQAGALLDEFAALISNPKGGPSMVDADRAKWDYHPIMSSKFSTRRKADPGLFYKQAETRDFRGMVQLMKKYVADRGKWVDSNLLVDSSFPPAPKIAAPSNLNPSDSKLQLRIATKDQVSRVSWRLAEISNPNDFASGVRRPGRYEINALWETTGGPSVEIPTSKLETGRTYRIRARVQNSSGTWSRWSAPIQFTKSQS
jgi:hypothetical protein